MRHDQKLNKLLQRSSILDSIDPILLLCFCNDYLGYELKHTLREVPKYGVFSGPYFPVFGLNMGKYRRDKTPDSDTSRSV